MKIQGGTTIVVVLRELGFCKGVIGMDQSQEAREYLPGDEMQDVRRLKMGGFIKLKEKDMYALRLKVPMGNLPAEVLPKLAEVATKYGRGRISLTVRQGIEIPWVHYRNLESARQALQEVGIELAGCGPRVRSIVTCKGKVCPYGLFDTFALGEELDQAFFGPRQLPHKYKIGVSGCPNSCSKPQFNDVGYMGQVEPELKPGLCTGCEVCVEACEDGALTMQDGLPVRDPEKCIYCGTCIQVCPLDAWVEGRIGLAVFVGGKFGKHPRFGYRIADLLPLAEAVPVCGRIMDFYLAEGRKGERLVGTVDRLGVERFKEAVL